MSQHIGYTVYYKDTDGYELPLTEYGEFTIYPNEGKAKERLEELKESIDAILHPKIVYKTMRKGFFKKVVEEVKPLPLPDYQRKQLNQQLKTLHVRKVSVI
ncbi:hypothetical protein Henu6_gp87 [Acinetobacter phage Henu6]|uniref:Uncharacterized protein n=2 Tax=Caudoviricetes TaxID=2731619 RepID=A0A410T5Q4_9CAUD|nr:hypothetical protein Henu6_gp87 [Acinetobacter phage Henu6]